LQPRGKPLCLRNALDFERDRIYRCFDFPESIADGGQFSGWYWLRFQPFGYQSNQRRTQDHYHEAGNYVTDDFVDDQIGIRRHFSLDSCCDQQALPRGKRIARFIVDSVQTCNYKGATVKALASLILLFAVAAACETTSDPLDGIGGTGGGGVVTQGQAAGNWSLTLRRTTTLGCSGASLADGQVLTTHLDLLTDGTANGTTSTWQNPPNAVLRPVGGTVRLTDGFTDLLLLASSGNTSSGMELRGTLTSTGSFTGTLTDPAPGLTPVFSIGGCEYSVTGTKTS
jgi:hypothetical protein